MPCFCKSYTNPRWKKLDFRRGFWYNKFPLERGYNWIQDVWIRNAAQPPNACGMLRENTAVCTLCFLVLSASEQMNKQSRLWISKPLHRTSFWSERKTPADFWCLCVSAFLFCRLQLNDRLNGIWFCDDSFLGKQSETTPLKKQGQERHSGKTAERKIVSISVASIGLWPPQSQSTA